MTASASTGPTRDERRARLAVAAFFFANGASYANVVPRLPEIKDALELSNTLYGLSIVAFPVGALISGLFAGSLIRRLGSARLAAIGSIALPLAILLVGIAPVPAIFALGMLLAGMIDSPTDVAQNAHGLRVQKRYGRSIINSFHAIWSLGAVVGGLMSAGAIALGLPIGLHLIINAALFATVALIAYRLRLRGPDEPEIDPETENALPAASEVAQRARVSPALIGTFAALALIAIAATVVEDVGSSWATLYMSDGVGAAAAIAPLGYIALIGFQFVGRLVGDRMVDRLGQRTVARIGGALVLIGMGSALAFPSVPGTLLGFAAAGFGVATLVPATMQAADSIPGLRPGTGLTLVTWLMRVGFLLSPLVIGIVSDATDLRISLLLVPLVGLLVLALSGVLDRRKPALPSS
ncbi:MFS transporter [Naasia lichenicola]|uniref:MFS transporter n=1 Tax=Naasia lichenicola TaxID=2565933 RepID=A0A4S4FRP1_9MICO|nr:MFS transporter [Naasia lichenicola]THG33329.1 MFS transporter [Naasia lichenicola]